MKSLALVLVIIGILALLYGVIGYNDHHTTIAMGSMTASITDHTTTPIAAMVAGGIALIGGLLLLANDRRHA
jgi:uncharacterized membrane protein YidH (DUF202 family)